MASPTYVLANASFNLTVNKKKALAEAHRILKPGGRLIARELIREGELPDEIAQDPQAWNASLGGVCEQGPNGSPCWRAPVFVEY